MVYRKFGIELELTGNTSSEEIQEEDGHLNDQGWAVVEDGSICSDDDYGIELVSPKLHPKKGFEEIKRVLNHMKQNYEIGVNNSCGFHVHFDFTKEKRSGDEKTIKKILLAYRAYEPYFMMMIPKSRWANSYCKTLEHFPVGASVFGRLADMYGRGRFDGWCKYDSLRYHSLNVHSWFFRGTLEVRNHSGTYDYSKIKNWVLLHQKFFEQAVKKPLEYWVKHRASNKTWRWLIGTKSYSYFLKRALTLHTNIIKTNIKKQRETLKQELQTLTKHFPRAKNLRTSIEDEEVREIMAEVF